MELEYNGVLMAVECLRFYRSQEVYKYVYSPSQGCTWIISHSVYFHLSFLQAVV